MNDTHSGSVGCVALYTAYVPVAISSPAPTTQPTGFQKFTTATVVAVPAATAGSGQRRRVVGARSGCCAVRPVRAVGTETR